MTLTTSTFLHNVARVRDLGDEALGKDALDRLVRLAQRCMALEAVLGADDPGHEVTAAVVRPTENRTKAVWNFSRMGRALLASTGPFEPGVCRVCGCTEVTACTVETPLGPAGCGWVGDSNRTLCTRPECVAAGIAVGDVVLPTNHEPTPAIARFLPEEIDGKAGTFSIEGFVNVAPPGGMIPVVEGRFVGNAFAGSVVTATLGERTGDVYVEGRDIDRIVGRENPLDGC